MSVDNSRTTERLKLLVSLGLNPEVFNNEHEWVKTGNTGVAHASKMCYKFNPSYRAKSVVFTSSPLLVKRPCVDCFNESIDKGLSDNIQIASKFAKKLEFLEVEKSHSARTSSALLLKCINLKEALGILDGDEHFQSYVENVRNILDKAIAKFKISSSGASEELTRLTATEYYYSLYNNKTPKVSNEDDRIFGYQGNGFVSVQLFEEFKKLFVKNTSKDTIIVELHKMASKFKVRDTSQLAFKINETFSIANSLETELNNQWEKKVKQLTSDYFEQWYSDCMELIQNKNESIIALSGVDNLDDMASAIIATFKLSSTKKALALKVPEVVALWISKCYSFGYSTKINIVNGISKGSLPEIMSTRGEEVANSALTLWEPYSENSYKKYSDALKAAIKL